MPPIHGIKLHAPQHIASAQYFEHDWTISYLRDGTYHTVPVRSRNAPKPDPNNASWQFPG